MHIRIGPCLRELEVARRCVAYYRRNRRAACQQHEQDTHQKTRYVSFCLNSIGEAKPERTAVVPRGRHKPEATDQKGAFTPGQAIIRLVGIVAKQVVAAPQPLDDGIDSARQRRLIQRKAHGRRQQKCGIECGLIVPHASMLQAQSFDVRRPANPNQDLIHDPLLRAAVHLIVHDFVIAAPLDPSHF